MVVVRSTESILPKLYQAQSGHIVEKTEARGIKRRAFLMGSRDEEFHDAVDISLPFSNIVVIPVLPLPCLIVPSVPQGLLNFSVYFTIN